MRVSAVRVSVVVRVRVSASASSFLLPLDLELLLQFDEFQLLFLLQLDELLLQFESDFPFVFISASFGDGSKFERYHLSISIITASEECDFEDGIQASNVNTPDLGQGATVDLLNLAIGDCLSESKSVQPPRDLAELLSHEGHDFWQK